MIRLFLVKHSRNQALDICLKISGSLAVIERNKVYPYPVIQFLIITICQVLKTQGNSIFLQSFLHYLRSPIQSDGDKCYSVGLFPLLNYYIIFNTGIDIVRKC